MTTKELFGNINLEAFVHVKRKMKTKDGREIDVLIIPVEANKLYVGEKSTNANIKVRFSDRKDEYGNNGFIAKQASIKELFGEGLKYDDLSTEQKDHLNKLSPILGNLKSFDRQETSNEVSDILEKDEDDLPF